MRVRRGPAKGMKWTVGSGNHGCWLGTYESDKQQALERLVIPGMMVFDIGAQTGFYTLIFSRLVGEQGRVYAFEPFPDNVHRLLAHLRLNKVGNAQVIHAAVAEHSSLSGFSVDHGSYRNKLADGAEAVLLVATTSLDDVVERHGLTPPGLIKMDVEGAESTILEGARRLLERHRPILFVALHGGEQRRGCQRLMKKVGYTIYDLKGTPQPEDLETDEVYALPT